LDIGGVNLHAAQVALGIGGDMALAAFDLLARIEGSRAAAFGGLHRLAVDDARRGAGLSSERLTRGHDQHAVDVRQQTLVRPSVEIAWRLSAERERSTSIPHR
jgi:hypothetical protein